MANCYSYSLTRWAIEVAIRRRRRRFERCTQVRTAHGKEKIHGQDQPVEFVSLMISLANQKRRFEHV